MFSASTHTLWFSFVPQKVSVLFFKTQVMKGGTGLGRGAAIEKGSQRKELQDVPECVSPLSKYRQRQDGERAPDSRKMPSAIQSLPRQHGPRAQSARVHTHTHTHTHTSMENRALPSQKGFVVSIKPIKIYTTC